MDGKQSANKIIQQVDGDARDVPKEVKAFFQRHRCLRDVPSSALPDLTRVLCLPYDENIPKPSKPWLKRQRQDVKGLDSSLKRPHNPITRLFIFGGHKSMSYCPRSSTLCHAHKKLDARVIHNLLLMIAAETCEQVAPLRRFNIEVKLHAQVTSWLRRMALLGGLWSTREAFHFNYRFEYKLCDELMDLQLTSLSNLEERNLCHACNLAAIGGRSRALMDLRAGLLARRELYGNGSKANRLIFFIDAWITGFSETQQKKFFKNSKRLGKRIAQAYRDVYDNEALRDNREGGQNRLEEWMQNSFASQSTAEIKSPFTELGHDVDEIHPKIMDPFADPVDEVYVEKADPFVDPANPFDDTDEEESTGLQQEEEEVTRQWLESKMRGMDDTNRSAFMGVLGSTFTVPSAAPAPLSTPKRKGKEIEIVNHRAPSINSSVPRHRKTIAARDTYSDPVTSTQPLPTPPPARPASTAGPSREANQYEYRASTVEDATAEPKDRDDVSSWVSASVYTYVPPSTRAPSVAPRPSSMGYGGLPTPDWAPQPTLPRGGGGGTRSTPRGLPPLAFYNNSNNSTLALPSNRSITGDPLRDPYLQGPRKNGSTANMANASLAPGSFRNNGSANRVVPPRPPSSFYSQ